MYSFEPLVLCHLVPSISPNCPSAASGTYRIVYDGILDQTRRLNRHRSLWWVSRYHFVVKIRVQPLIPQWNLGFSGDMHWVLRCLLRLPGFANVLPHIGHSGLPPDVAAAGVSAIPVVGDEIVLVMLAVSVS